MGLCTSRNQSGEVTDLIQEVELDPFKAIDKSHHELILQHFTGIELLDTSEVSPKWFNLIAKSEISMKKIELKIIDGDLETKNEIIELVSQSPRQYQNLHICSQNKMKLVLRFAPSLTEVRICCFDMNVGELEIPNLKKLIILNGDAIANGLINSSTSLEELHLKSIRTSAADAVVECLKVNKQLKFLSLGTSPSVIFKEDLSSMFEFQLVAVSAKLFFLPDPTNFFTFLHSQAESLRQLTVHVTSCDSSIFSATINNLPKLERLEIFGAAEVYGIAKSPPHDLPERLDLKPNQSVKVLRVERLRLYNLSSLKSLLLALPNLKSFRVLDSTKDALICVMQNAEKITDFKTLLISLKIVHDEEDDDS